MSDEKLYQNHSDEGPTAMDTTSAGKVSDSAVTGQGSIIYGLPPSQATLAPAPLTIESQVWGNEPSREAIEARLQLFYLASRFLGRCRPEAKRKNAYMENLKATLILAHRIGLDPREIFQLLRLEFNPRLNAPLSEDALWRLIRSMGRPSTTRSDRLKDPTKPAKPLRPLCPKWMREKSRLFFWYPSRFHKERWIEAVSRKTPQSIREFLEEISQLQDERQRAQELGGPPLADHPMTMTEISDHLNITVRDVVDCIQLLDSRSLIDYITLDFLPGVYSGGFVPHPQAGER